MGGSKGESLLLFILFVLSTRWGWKREARTDMPWLPEGRPPGILRADREAGFAEARGAARPGKKKHGAEGGCAPGRIRGSSGAVEAHRRSTLPEHVEGPRSLSSWRGGARERALLRSWRHGGRRDGRSCATSSRAHHSAWRAAMRGE